jgi:uncharacterized protein
MTANQIIEQRPSRTWEVLCHVSALSMFVGIPFGNIVGPLIVWLLKRGDSASIDEHGKESLNFQLSLTLYLIVITLATVVLTFLIVGVLLWPVLIAAFVLGPFIDLILVIIASVKASNGELYRYPFTLRLID